MILPPTVSVLCRGPPVDEPIVVVPIVPVPKTNPKSCLIQIIKYLPIACFAEWENSSLFRLRFCDDEMINKSVIYKAAN